MVFHHTENVSTLHETYRRFRHVNDRAEIRHRPHPQCPIHKRPTQQPLALRPEAREFVHSDSGSLAVKERTAMYLSPATATLAATVATAASRAVTKAERKHGTRAATARRERRGSPATLGAQTTRPPASERAENTTNRRGRRCSQQTAAARPSDSGTHSKRTRRGTATRERRAVSTCGVDNTHRDTFLAPTCIRSPVPAAGKGPSGGPKTDATGERYVAYLRSEASKLALLGYIHPRHLPGEYTHTHTR